MSAWKPWASLVANERVDVKLGKKRMQGANTETQMERPSGEDTAAPGMKGVLMVEKYDPM